ncbi:fasciclin-like arabinogalactan protein 12 [Mercurialis annua]|uniref:fasciclin-like arabinogalactan protein 12 n=1 Tax=Mercurialis annua TaxID=3986 RepID=UPI00215DEF57|nr:fasciclin-like arabinogalactan protein 12 [Mercurialis annua]
MKQQTCLLSFSLLIFFFLILHSTAQSPAPAPTPEGPTNIIKILKKSGEFKTFIHLLKTTQLDSNLNSQLDNTNNGLTIFAPSDTAFSSLKKRTLTSLTRQEKVELAQFHIVPTFISDTQFDTVTNPLKTHAGSGTRFQLNVTTSGNLVSIATGLTNTTVSETVYLDHHLAIYKVDKVLLPLDIFTPKPPPAAAPEPVAKKSEEESVEDDDSEDDDDDDDENSVKNVKSGAVSLVVDCNLVLIGVIGVVAATFSL